MRFKWIVIIVLIVLLLGVAILHDKGIISIPWQWLSVLIAGLLAPFKYLYSILTPNKDKIEAIKEEHRIVRDQEHKYQRELEARIKEREIKIDTLNKEINLLNTKVKVLEERSSRVEEMVSNMGIEEKKDKFTDLFGK